MTRFLRIEPDGTEQVVELSNLLDAQEAVGGYIELVPFTNHNRTVICNEEGILRGLPHNQKASELVGYGLVGTVLIGGPIDSEGEITDYPEGEEA